MPVAQDISSFARRGYAPGKPDEQRQKEGPLFLPPRMSGAYERKNGSSVALFQPADSTGNPLAFGQRTLPGDGLSLAALTAMIPTRGGANELTNPYRENGTIFACCKVFSDCVGSVPVQVFASEAEDAEPLGPEDPVVRLFASPTNLMTGMQARIAAAVDRKLTGENLWFLADGQGKPIAQENTLFLDLPAQIISCSGFKVGDRRDSQGRIVAWSYGTAGGMAPEFAAESVLHFADYNPDDPQRGLGAAQVAMRQLGIAFQAERHLEGIFRAGGPGYFLQNKQLLEEAQARREQLELEDRLQASESGAPKIIRGEWSILPIPGTSKDLGVFDALSRADAVICSIMGVPSPCIGLLEQAKYSNMQEAWKQLWLNIAGYLRGLEDVINTQFFPRLRDRRLAAYRVRFDLSKVDALKQDNSAQAELALKFAQAGVGMSVSGGAKFVGFEYDETIEGVDTQTMSTSLTPLDPEIAQLVLDAKPPPPPMPTPGAATEKPPPAKALRASLLPAEITELDRRRYQRVYEWRALVMHDLRLYSRVYRFLAKYEEAQLAKLNQVAGAKDAADLATTRSSEARSTVAELEELLLLSEEKWAEEFRKILGGSVGDVYEHSLSDMANELGVPVLPMTDPAIQRMLATQLTQLVEGVNSTLALRVKAALIRVLGEPSTITDLRQAVQAELPDLTDELRRVFGTKGARAMTIARTETGRASSGARVAQMREAGIEEIEWVSAADDAVRESHRKLDGQHRELGKEFKSDLRWPHDERGPAGEVINCFLPGTLVQGAMLAGLSSRYAGEAVEIQTARGHVLRVTPNHPILTAKGWRAAHALAEGDDLLSDRRHVDGAVLRDPHDQQGEAPIEQVFDALATQGRVRLEVVGTLNLHGDARGIVSEVDVVGADGELGDELRPSRQLRTERGLVLPDARRAALHAGGALDADLGGVALAAPPVPGRPALPLHDAPELRRVKLATLRPLRSLGFGAAARAHAVADEHAKQRSSADPRLVRELLETLTPGVALDQVVKVRRFFHSGHVFDLQSATGWILASGIVSGNCRCVARPIVKV